MTKKHTRGTTTNPFEFIEYYYNRVRTHSPLGYKSPVEFEDDFYQNSLLDVSIFLGGDQWDTIPATMTKA